MNEENAQRRYLIHVLPMDRHLGKEKWKVNTYDDAHACHECVCKIGASTAKVERSKRPKCEVLNEDDLAHIQGIAVMKFMHNCIHYTVAY